MVARDVRSSAPLVNHRAKGHADYRETVVKRVLAPWTGPYLPILQTNSVISSALSTINYVP